MQLRSVNRPAPRHQSTRHRETSDRGCARPRQDRIGRGKTEPIFIHAISPLRKHQPVLANAQLASCGVICELDIK
jgi:hypothetical protein